MSAERRVPLGTSYNNFKGNEVISFPITLRIVRYEVRDTLADYYINCMLLDNKVPAPSSFGVRKVRQVLESEYTSRGGSAPGDEVNTADEKDQDEAYTWADRVLARVWPNVAVF